ncbi:MAG: biotin--[acetyl-CoA-carboxylase] ligase [Methanobacteriaceae archaeon]
MDEIKKGLKNSDEIKKSLESKYIGSEIYYYSEVDSTNNLAKRLAENGAIEGTIVISDTQKSGKGRMGKKWESPTGGIWLSMVLRPKVSLKKAPLITLATGVAVARTLKGIGVDAKIKWPNDVLVDNKKISGILTEANANFNTLDYVVVGIGIDTNLNPETFSEELRANTTTLKRELDQEINDFEIIPKLLKEMEEVYNLFKEEEYEKILSQWRELSQTIGKSVKIRQPLGKVLEGYAIGINNEGVLIIELEDGSFKKIVSGECINNE